MADYPVRAMIVAPKHDLATKGGHKVAKMLERILQKRGIGTIFMGESDATRETVAGQIDQQHPTLIIYVGHGEQDLLYGQVPPGDQIPMVEDQENPELLRDTVAVAIACKSLALLGSVAVFKGGCNIYIGSEDIYYLPESLGERDYHEDFARCILAMLLSLLQGDSAKDAMSEYRALCKDFEQQYEEMGTPTAMTMKNWMEINRKGMGIRGEAAGGLIFGVHQ